MLEPMKPAPSEEASLKRALDSKTIEMLAFTVFRTVFRDGLHVPIKMTGLTDMDLLVRDADVTVNLNEVQVQVPPLVIWRVTLAYQGRPLVEYGRGIKNDMKVHLGQLLFLMLIMWRERRKNRSALAAAEAARIARTRTGPQGGATGVEVEGASA